MPGIPFRDFPIIIAASCLPCCCRSATFLMDIRSSHQASGIFASLILFVVQLQFFFIINRSFHMLSWQYLSNLFLRRDNNVLHGPILRHGLAENQQESAQVNCESEVRHQCENASILSKKVPWLAFLLSIYLSQNLDAAKAARLHYLLKFSK